LLGMESEQKVSVFSSISESLNRGCRRGLNEK